MPTKTKKQKGKWAHLVGTLPKLVQEEPSRQEQIEFLKGEIITECREEQGGLLPTAAYLVDKYLSVRGAREDLEQQVKDLELEEAALKQMLEAQYEAEGVSNIKLRDGSSLGMHPEPHAVVVDKDKNREWATKNGLERHLALPWSTVNKELKEALERGENPPDGVEAFMITKFTRR
jgi:hypothetical protein